MSKSRLIKRLVRILVISLLMFMLGFVNMERLKFLNTKENAMILAECLNARNSIRINDSLDYEDILFLEEHVFGRWKFSKRITSSISSIGEIFLFFWVGYQCAARVDIKKKNEQIQKMIL